MSSNQHLVRVHVLLFAAFRETLGTNELTIELPEGSTPEELFRRLERLEPRLARLRPYTTFAVNREVVPASHFLRDGDEVAMLQPVSGGLHA